MSKCIWPTQKQLKDIFTNISFHFVFLSFFVFLAFCLSVLIFTFYVFVGLDCLLLFVCLIISVVLRDGLKEKEHKAEWVEGGKDLGGVGREEI